MTASFCIKYVDYLLIDMGSCGECVSSGFSYQCQAGISKLRPCSPKNNMHNFHIILCLARYSLCKFMWLTFHSCPRQQDFERSHLNWRIGKWPGFPYKWLFWLVMLHIIILVLNYIIFQSRGALLLLILQHFLFGALLPRSGPEGLMILMRSPSRAAVPKPGRLPAAVGGQTGTCQWSKCVGNFMQPVEKMQESQKRYWAGG